MMMTTSERPAAGVSPRAPRRPREIQLNTRYRPAPATPGSSPVRPVFLVHDGFGETLHYRKLAELLSPQIPVYGLHPMPHDGLVMAHTRIKDIAAAYVERVRRVQPEGPYLLGGLCAGGVIAFEMAHLLQRAGAEIQMLALLDSSRHGEPMRTGRFAARQIHEFGDALARRLSRANPFEWLAGMAEFGSGLARLMAHQAVARTTRAKARFKAQLLRHYLDAGRPPPEFVRDLSVNQIYNLAESDPASDASFNGDVLLFRASSTTSDFGDEPFRNLFSDPLFGWSSRVSGTVRTVDVGGGHYSMLDEPHVEALARHIQQHLDTVMPPRQPADAR